MNRDESLQAIADRTARWGVLVIGGGATGLGAAVEAASRGYRTLLLEQHDFAKGTSSRSTKLIHGGVRYLRQGNVSLVRDSLRERALLLRNAPHLTRRQSFVIPAYAPFDRAFYGVGLKLYDALAGGFGIGASKVISREQTLLELPTLAVNGLRGGVQYFDGQFDDARLAIALAQTLHGLGGIAANYVRVSRLLKQNGRINGVIARDEESGQEFEINVRVVINATGVFTDSIRRFDDESVEPLVTSSQGAHIVIARSFLSGESALMVPKTKDGRVLFAIPWHDCVVIGTTDTPVSETALEPRPLAREIEFLLEHAQLYLSKPPAESDILSTFAGLRPLVKAGPSRTTAQLSRDHVIVISNAGLVTITGGKWTTYRKMGEDVVTQAAKAGGLEARPSRTRELRLHGADQMNDQGQAFECAQAIARNHNEIAAITIRAAREEMARTVEDVLARRSRILMLDARAAIDLAPKVASILGSELGRDADWEREQVSGLTQLAEGYCLSGIKRLDSESAAGGL